MASTTTTDMTREQIEAAAAALGLVVKTQPVERSRPAAFGEADTATLAWIEDNARPAESPCLCGCGTKTKGRFAPGHDAVLKSRLQQTPGDQARQIEQAFGWPSEEPKPKPVKKAS